MILIDQTKRNWNLSTLGLVNLKSVATTDVALGGGWHSGGGIKGNANFMGYGFEICEDSLSDKNFNFAIYKATEVMCDALQGV